MAKFSINSMKPVKIKEDAKLFKNNAFEFLMNRKLVSDAISLALLEGDEEAFFEIITGYLAVVNKEELARRANIPIATV